MSRTRWPLLAAFLMVAGAGGCDNTASQKEALNDLLKTNQELLAVLKDVKDQPSMEKARPELRKMSWRLEKLAKRLKDLGKPSTEVLSEVEGPHNELREQLKAEVLRITQLPGGQAFADAMKHL